MINNFKNIFTSNVEGSLDIYSVLDCIKSPDPDIVNLINGARKYYQSGDFDKYDNIKKSLPCFCFNFEFNSQKSNNNINRPTGFIYIDIDGHTDINFANEYIFSTWVSLSGAGRGVLVRVNNLSENNFKETYNTIGELLSIQADFGARKATQFTVHSYDPNLYLNNESTIFAANSQFVTNPTVEDNYITEENVHYTYNNKKEKKVSGKLNNFNKLRYNNIDEYDFQGKDYIVFEEDKEWIAELYFPKNIKTGKRNTVLSTSAEQLLALNSMITYDEFYNKIFYANSNCDEPLKESETLKIINKKWSKKDNLFPTKNKPRRIIFDPEVDLSKTEKLKKTGKVMGEIKTNKTIKSIAECISNWDVCSYGKITQIKVVDCVGRGRTTLSKHWKLFEDEIKNINDRLKTDYCFTCEKGN